MDYRDINRNYAVLGYVIAHDRSHWIDHQRAHMKDFLPPDFCPPWIHQHKVNGISKQCPRSGPRIAL